MSLTCPCCGYTWFSEKERDDHVAYMSLSIYDFPEAEAIP